MKSLKHFLKPLSFLPAILMLYIIFQFSHQTAQDSSNLSHKVTQKLVTVADDIKKAGWDESQLAAYIKKLDPYTRKLAHITEYFLLAICVALPLYVYGMRGIPLMFFAGGLCIACGVLDEYHQSFVAGRGPSLRDVGIDSIGIFFGIILVRMVCFTGRMTIFRERKKKNPKMKTSKK